MKLRALPDFRRLWFGQTISLFGDLWLLPSPVPMLSELRGEAA